MIVESNTNFADLKELFADKHIPDDAKVRITTCPGDQRDPSYSTLTFEWKT